MAGEQEEQNESGVSVSMRALLTAQKAVSKVDSHEKVCEERHKAHETFQAQIMVEIKKVSEEVERLSNKLDAKLDKLYTKAWVIAGAIIMILLTVSGYLYIESQQNMKMVIEKLQDQSDNQRSGGN